MDIYPPASGVAQGFSPVKRCICPRLAVREGHAAVGIGKGRGARVQGEVGQGSVSGRVGLDRARMGARAGGCGEAPPYAALRWQARKSRDVEPGRAAQVL